MSIWDGKDKMKFGANTAAAKAGNTAWNFQQRQMTGGPSGAPQAPVRKARYIPAPLRPVAPPPAAPAPDPRVAAVNAARTRLAEGVAPPRAAGAPAFQPLATKKNFFQETADAAADFDPTSSGGLQNDALLVASGGLYNPITKPVTDQAVGAISGGLTDTFGPPGTLKPPLQDLNEVPQAAPIATPAVVTPTYRENPLTAAFGENYNAAAARANNPADLDAARTALQNVSMGGEGADTRTLAQKRLADLENPFRAGGASRDFITRQADIEGEQALRSGRQNLGQMARSGAGVGTLDAIERKNAVDKLGALANLEGQAANFDLQAAQATTQGAQTMNAFEQATAGLGLDRATAMRDLATTTRKQDLDAMYQNGSLSLEEYKAANQFQQENARMQNEASLQTALKNGDIEVINAKLREIAASGNIQAMRDFLLGNAAAQAAYRNYVTQTGMDLLGLFLEGGKAAGGGGAGGGGG